MTLKHLMLRLHLQSFGECGVPLHCHYSQQHSNLEIWKWYAVLFGIHIGSEIFRVFGCQSEDRFIWILMKVKSLADNMVFGMVTSDGDVIPPFIYPHGLRLNKEAYIKCLEGVVPTGSTGWLLEDPMSGNRTLSHAHKQENPVLAGVTFLQTYHLKIWLLNSPNCNSFDYYVWGTVEQETNKTPCNIKNELNSRIIIEIISRVTN